MMRRNYSILALLVVGVGPNYGQQPAATTQLERITVEEVEVRAGPSTQFPTTAKLRLGDMVRVRSRDAGWLAIEPPAGSLSWVPAEHVNRLNGTNTLVLQGDEEVSLRVGGALVRQPLPVKGPTAKPGTQFYLMGDKIVFESTDWWPIQPLKEESRYLPASAIALPAPGASASARTTNTTTTGTGSSTADKEELWARAQIAEKEGRWDDAERMYAHLAQKHMQAGGDFRFAQACAGRIEEIRRLRRTPGALMSRNPAEMNGALTSMSKSGSGTSSLDSPPPPPLPGARWAPRIEPAPPRDGERSSGIGVLNRSTLKIDGLTTYSLETSRGQLICYVTPTPGLDLEPYVNRSIELAGIPRLRSDVYGHQHFTATRVLYAGR